MINDSICWWSFPPFSLETQQDQKQEYKHDFPKKNKVAEGSLKHLTWHVGPCHDSSAAIEHDGKHFDKTHDGTSCIVNCVTGFENNKGKRGMFYKSQIEVKSASLHFASW